MARPLLFDSSAFLKELHDQHLRDLVPDLDIHVGDVPRERLAAHLAGRTHILDDHTRLDRAMLEQLPDLRCIVFLGTGSSSYIDEPAAAERGITVRNFKGYGDRSVAEHALALTFAAFRDIARMDRETRAGRFEPRNGREILGKTLGIVGTGGIGAELARMAAALGMRVLAWNRSGVPAGLPVLAMADLDTLLANADVVSLHLGLNEGTRGLLDARRLGLLAPGAVLVNTARGGVLDEPALVALLQAGRIGHAALDVFADEPLPPGHPLLALGNVTLTPHAGFMTEEASINLLRMGLEIVAEERGLTPDR